MAAFAYFIAGAIIYRWGLGPDGLAMLWPAGGIFVATLLLSSRSHWPAVLALFTAANFFGAWLFGVEPGVAVICVCAHTVNAILCPLIFGKERALRGFETIADLSRFTMAAAIGAVASWLVIAVSIPDRNWSNMFNWMVTLLLGTLIVASMIITVTREFEAKRPKWSAARTAEFLGLVGLLIAVAWYSVTRASVPMLYLPFAGAVLVTYRLGPIGAAACVTAIAAVGTFAITLDLQQMGSLGHSKAGIVYFYQFYLFVILAVCLPLAALLTQRRDMFRKMRTSQELLASAERLANIGHWYLNLRTNELIWSDGIRKIYDLPPDEMPSIELVREFCHPEDRAKVATRLNECIAEGQMKTGTARIIRRDGTIRHVESVLMREVDGRNRPLAIFGTFQDVTEKVEVLKQLEAAKESAEVEAFAARLLADTDPLTGVNSRRKILELLDEQMDECSRTNRNLSVAILDIDHFKSINDQFGHATGDLVLQRVSAICRKAISGLGHVGRLGGEEFLFVIPDAGEAGAGQLIEGIRTALLAENWGEMDDLEVTGSFGLASMLEGADETWMLQAADNALYEAKHAGRNCIRIAA